MQTDGWVDGRTQNGNRVALQDSLRFLFPSRAYLSAVAQTRPVGLRQVGFVLTASAKEIKNCRYGSCYAARFPFCCALVGFML